MYVYTPFSSYDKNSFLIKKKVYAEGVDNKIFPSKNSFALKEIDANKTAESENYWWFEETLL